MHETRTWATHRIKLLRPIDILLGAHADELCEIHDQTKGALHKKAFVTTQGVGGSCTQLHDTHHARIGERCKQERDDDEQDDGWDRHGD